MLSSRSCHVAFATTTFWYLAMLVEFGSPKGTCFVDAWIPNSPSSSSSSFMSLTPSSQRVKSSSTQRYMFDWLNPQSKAKKEEEAKKEEKPVETPVAAATAEAAAAAAEPELALSATSDTTTDTETAAETTNSDIHIGTVNWFDRKKGFGFIKSADGSRTDIFVHQSQIQAEGYRFLFPGEPVEYKIQESPNNQTQAIHVTGPAGGDLRITILRKRKEEEEKEQA